MAGIEILECKYNDNWKSGYDIGERLVVKSAERMGTLSICQAIKKVNLRIIIIFGLTFSCM